MVDFLMAGADGAAVHRFYKASDKRIGVAKQRQRCGSRTPGQCRSDKFLEQKTFHRA
ncbi:hypothetical protein RCH09_002134 [Actimicrobium sp. GrIS 1.19]|uniref:hypothetical protein n=1 Tax=Actimicrobium sp. GrIS 1.19 TaxID=3071708 RepID=UPI002E03F294|nr:hypothetical protein [Actimicrobium sp. GrIS 1.19]